MIAFELGNSSSSDIYADINVVSIKIHLFTNLSGFVRMIINQDTSFIKNQVHAFKKKY